MGSADPSEPSFNFDDPSTQLAEFERFAEFWCGPHHDDYRLPASELDDLVMPDPLRWFFGYAGRWPHDLSWGSNRFFLEDVLQLPDATTSYTADGLIVFGAAEQAYCKWATKAENVADAPAYGDSGEQPVFGERWDLYAESLQEFLLRLLFRNCCAHWRVHTGALNAPQVITFAESHKPTGQLLFHTRWDDDSMAEPVVLAHDPIVTNDLVLLRWPEGWTAPQLASRSEDGAKELSKYLSSRN